MASWTLIYNGVGGTLDDWGVSQLNVTRVSQGMDTLTFVADGKLFDSDQAFAFGGTVEITLGGVTWFVGTVIRVPRRASGPMESLQYTVAGPWYWLDQLIFKLVWQYRNGNTNVAVPLSSSHLLLNVSNGVWVNTGVMIAGAVNYAISRGAPMQVGIISPALLPPIDEARDITCGEVIHKMLRWHPQAVTWFDYTTKPYPSFNCRNMDELPGVSLSLPPDETGPHPTAYEINALDEAVRPSVCINYERTNTVNDQAFFRLIQDIAPAGASGNELKCWTVTVDLMGAKVSVVSADIVCDPIPDSGSDAEKLAWLKAHSPDLQDPNLTGLRLVSFARRDGSLRYPNELTSGQIADWMDFNSEDDMIFAHVAYTKTGLDGVSILATPDIPIKVRFKATDGVTGTYQNTTVTDEADALPIGVANYLYNQVKDLKYGGSFELTELELSVPAKVGIGNKVNLIGSRLEWATMNALVQQISEELDTGRTTITFGPPSHLGPADLIELCRINRNRRRDTPTSAMTSGRAPNGQLKLGEKMPNNDSSHNDADISYRIVRSGTVTIVLDGAGSLSIVDSVGPKGVTLGTAACIGGGQPRTLAVREVAVCEKVSGVDKVRKMLVVGSISYD